jgi:hypothetical protein
VALAADGESRLAEFIEWVFLSGVEENRLPDFRRIGAELFDLAAGGRVNESHILRLIDARSEGPSGKANVSLIEDVGEQILRFQAARKSNPSLTPVPMAPPAAPARNLRSSTSQPFVARPEERVAGELRPPVAVTADSGGPGSVVSFATGSVPPPPPGLSTPPVPPMAGSGWTQSNPPSPPGNLLALAQHSPPVTDKSTRRSATLFRCWRCKIMVESDPSGACPRCGTPAPRVASAPMPVIGTSSRNWLIGVGAAFAIGVVGVLFVPRLVERMHHPSTPVAEELRSSHLGVRIVFPNEPGDRAGWRHLREGDQAPTANLGPLGDLVGEPLSLRSSRFFRGSVGNPDAELYVVVGARASSVTEASLGAWAQAIAGAPDKLVDPIRELTGVSNVRFFKCAAGAGVPHGGLRCTGTASHTAAVLTIWSARQNVDIALFFSDSGPEAALTESTDLVTGLDAAP